MIIGFPNPPASGGPGSFQSILENALKKRGWLVIYPAHKEYPDIIVVVGGTRKLSWLLKNKLRKVPILLRLAGLDWQHLFPPVAPHIRLTEGATFLARCFV